MDLTRSMPFSAEAEEGCLACMLHDPANHLQAMRDAGGHEAFYHPANRLLAKTFLEFDARGKPLDIQALSHHFIDSGEIEKIGGLSKLAELYGQFPAAGLMPYCIKILTTKRQLREGISACLEAVDAAYSLPPSEDAGKWSAELLNKAMRLHESTVTTGRRSGRMLRSIGTSVMEARKAGHHVGISTGFPWLDKMTGGWRRGHQWVISGGTSDGKSALAEQMCLNAARDGRPGSVFSLEMPGEEWWERAASQEASVRSSVWQGEKFHHEERGPLHDFCGIDWPIKVYDDLRDWSDIMARVRLDHSERKIEWFMVDYLQLAQGNKSNGREREVANMSDDSKGIAMGLGITAIVLSQLNDEGKLRESRAIGQDADKLIKIGTEKDDDTIRFLDLEKNRGGPRFKRCRYLFEGEFFRWTEQGEVTKKHEKDGQNGAAKPKSHPPRFYDKK